MTLRFSERYVMGLNLLLIAILAYFLALSVNDIILGRVAGGAPAHLPSLLGAEPSAPVDPSPRFLRRDLPARHLQPGAGNRSSRGGRNQPAHQVAWHLDAHSFAAVHHRRR